MRSGGMRVSKQAIARFFEEVKTDKALRLDLKKTVTKSEFIIHAFWHGYTFTAKELDEFWIEKSGCAEPLTDAELFDITGGNCDGAGRLMTTMGYGCDAWKPSSQAWTGERGMCGSCAFWHIQNGFDALFAYLGEPNPCFCAKNRLA